MSHFTSKVPVVHKLVDHWVGILEVLPALVELGVLVKLDTRRILVGLNRFLLARKFPLIPFSKMILSFGFQI